MLSKKLLHFRKDVIIKLAWVYIKTSLENRVLKNANSLITNVSGRRYAFCFCDIENVKNMSLETMQNKSAYINPPSFHLNVSPHHNTRLSSSHNYIYISIYIYVYKYKLRQTANRATSSILSELQSFVFRLLQKCNSDVIYINLYNDMYLTSRSAFIYFLSKENSRLCGALNFKRTTKLVKESYFAFEIAH